VAFAGSENGLKAWYSLMTLAITSSPQLAPLSVDRLFDASCPMDWPESARRVQFWYDERLDGCSWRRAGLRSGTGTANWLGMFTFALVQVILASLSNTHLLTGTAAHESSALSISRTYRQEEIRFTPMQGRDY
jgi:hypothetical protein